MNAKMKRLLAAIAAIACVVLGVNVDPATLIEVITVAAGQV